MFVWKTHFLSGTQENLKFFSTAKTHLIYFVTDYDIVSYSSFISKGKLLGNVFFSILGKIVCRGVANVADFHGRPLLAPTGDVFISFYFIFLNFYRRLQYFFHGIRFRALGRKRTSMTKSLINQT